MSHPTFPRYVVMQYRVTESKKRNRIYAMVRTRLEAKAIVVHASSTRRNENEFYLVIDGTRTAADPDNTHFVGACCHASKEIVLMQDEDHPILLPIELASVYEGDASVKFMTDNRSRQTQPQPSEGEEASGE